MWYDYIGDGSREVGIEKREIIVRHKCGNYLCVEVLKNGCRFVRCECCCRGAVMGEFDPMGCPVRMKNIKWYAKITGAEINYWDRSYMACQKLLERQKAKLAALEEEHFQERCRMLELGLRK